MFGGWFSSQNGDLPWGCTTEEQSSIVLFSWAKDSMQRIVINKYFLLTIRSVCRVKQFTAGSRNVVNISLVTKRKWLRQQSKDFYAAGFDALVM
jgi:hypothetical protein